MLLVRCPPLQGPAEGDVLADPDALVIASRLVEDVLAAELRCALDHSREAGEALPGLQVAPDQQTSRLVVDIHAASSARRIAHGHMDRLEERMGDDHVRIDEDEHIPHGMTRPSVAGSCDVAHRLMHHHRAPVPSDGGGLIFAVVVNDDDVDNGV